MLLIFTDLDGTLLNPDDYRYDPALPVIRQLQAQGFPIIPVTSKTRAEVTVLCNTIGLNEPFITENGSGVFLPKTDTRFDFTPLNLPDTVLEGNHRLLRLGCTYTEARAGLRTLSKNLGAPLRGFGDLKVEEVQKRTGLSAQDAALAKTRDFTEPFITPQNILAETLKTVAEATGFKLTVGDRFSHLIGQGAGKGRAVQLLIKAYRSRFSDQPLTTIGLGNSPNDLEMLEAVDVPIVIPGKHGPHPDLADRNWTVAPAIGSQGWARVMQEQARP